MTITTQEELRALYGYPNGRAEKKVLPALEKHSKNFIQHAPFFVLATHSTNGTADASPRGGKAGFVKILDDNTLLIPDAKGNNRMDSLANIIDTGLVGCLFLIPGIDETLRINGNAIITTHPAYLNLFLEEQNPPKACIKITVQEVFLHCAKALMRSELWQTTYRAQRPGFPTMGTMLNEQLGTNVLTESQQDMVKRYQKDL